jgi:hypothetical protein
MTTYENETNPNLKPELAFEWIKYKKNTPPETTNFEVLENNQTHVKEKNKSISDDDITKEIPTQEFKENIPVKIQFSKEKYKNDPQKERLYLWYEKLFIQQEMTLEDFSKVIQMPDLMETEEFLFRFAPLRYSYSWRGKILKFSNETILKLQELLQE